MEVSSPPPRPCQLLGESQALLVLLFEEFSVVRGLKYNFFLYQKRVFFGASARGVLYTIHLFQPHF